MKKQDFFNEVKDTFELDEKVNEETTLHLTSILILSLIVIIDENFEMQIKASDLKSINTVRELMNLIGLGKFN